MIENNYKQIIPTVIALAFMLILLLGATYAFYTLQVNDSKTESNINVEMGKLNSIAIKGSVENLHLNVSVGDMSLEKKGSYYATKEPNENYKTDQAQATYDIAELQIEGNVESKNICTGELTVSLTNLLNSMGSALETGDAFLYIKGGNIEEKLDLSTIKTEGFKTYTIKFKVNDNSEQTVKAYIELVNKEEAQNYLAGKTLNLEIKIDNFKCEVYNTETLANLCSSYDNLGECIKSANLDTVANLETTANMNERNDNLRRYQGEAFDVDNNYVCFGTTEKSECTRDTDKYMYRIIGIVTQNGDNETEKIGQLKVIKKETLNETKAWHSSYNNDAYTWGYPSDLNTGINGTYFLTNTEKYPYMSNKDWTSQIVNHNWQYADVPNDATGYDASTDAKTLYVNEVNLWKNGSNKGTTTNKIGLMYVHDYVLATSNSALCHYTASSSEYVKCKASWIYLNNNDTGAPRTSYEWTMSRSSSFHSWGAHSYGYAGYYDFNDLTSVRPVFYIENTMQITSGSGTIDNPYIITGVSE